MRPSSHLHKPEPNGEAGFAMLLVFVMAASIAIMLYMELPRVSFEAQRDREGLLIERGEQYKRAIQLYFRRFKKYPSSLEQLEETNNIRFLRRRYVDPISGKAEWRLIHVSASGVFTDSITRKPQGKDGKDGKDAYKNTFITEGPTIGSALPQAGRASGPPRRPSEQPQTTPNPDDPGAAQNLAALAMGQSPGQQVPSQYAGTALPSQVPANVVPVSPFNMPAQPGQTGAGGVPVAGPIPATSDSSGNAPQIPGGFNPNQPAGSNQAADLIRNLLTTPRNYPVSPGPGLGTPAVGGGIAGVASTVERTGIKIYNDRDQYNEWEFIYDFGKDRTGMGRMAGQMGNGDPRLSNNGQNQQGGFGNQGAVPAQGGFAGGGFGAQGGQGGIVGAQPGFGAQGGFGQQPQAQSGQASSSSGSIGSGYSAPVGSGFDASANQQPSTPKRPPGQQPPAQQQPGPPAVPVPNQNQPPAGATPPAQGETPPQAPPPPSQPPQ